LFPPFFSSPSPPQTLPKKASSRELKGVRRIPKGKEKRSE
jgi:hypothetical protein